MPAHIKIEVRRMLRNKRYVFFVVAFPVLLYLLYSSLFGGQVDDSTGLRADVALMVSMAAYGGLAASIMTTAVPWAQERESGWLRQLQITPLADWAILVTKLLAALLMVLPSVLLVVLTAVLTRHVSMPAGEWIPLLVALWAGTIPFAALGLLIGSLLPADSAQPAAIIGMFALAILGGLWFPTDMLPETMRNIARVLPSYDYARIGWDIVAGRAPAGGTLSGILAWGVGLVALAIFAYRRATVRP
ncbi:MAG TPA: ABC transporter permease [Thermopolyspora sp.]|jgi:ABC-2 type transporter.